MAQVSTHVLLGLGDGQVDHAGDDLALGALLGCCGAVKIALVLQGYPPELVGGTEHSVRSLAHGLVRAGDEPVVIAGTDQWQDGFRVTEALDHEPDSRRPSVVRVFRIHRADMHYGHWQKALCRQASAAYTELLERERPDLVHVHHWSRLSRDLVARAVDLGIPAVLSLHDFSATCLNHHRVRRDTAGWCTLAPSSNNCLDCAAEVHGDTGWMDRSSQAELMHVLTGYLGRELKLASSILALSQDQADALEQLLQTGDFEGGFSPKIQVEPLPVSGGEAVDRELPPDLDGPTLRLGCWGNLGWHKGTDLLIDAVRRVVAVAGPKSIELHLAGVAADPEEFAELRRAARGLPVCIHGPFAKGTLAGHPVTQVHAFVSGTRCRETWGVTVDEARTLGLPLILPRFGAFPERLGEAGALFYSRGDFVGLADLLQRVLRQPAILSDTRVAADDRWRSAIGMEAHVGRLRMVYDRALRRGAPPAMADPIEPQGAESIGSVGWIRRWDDMLRGTGFGR